MSKVFDEKCKVCPEYARCRESFNSWIYFIIGLIATVAIRAVIIFHNISPVYGKLAWYVGVGGFFIFFLYKFRVGQRRSREIERLGLLDKLGRKAPLDDEDYTRIGAILCSLTANKERINYFFIFATSIIALSVAIAWDLLVR